MDASSRCHVTPSLALAVSHRSARGVTSKEAQQLLVAHAAGFCKEVYDALVQELDTSLSRPIQAVGFDFRGHGSSDKPSADELAALQATPDLIWRWCFEDVSAVAAGLTPGCLGFGHSLGGAALLELSCAAGPKFSAIMLYEPIVSPLPVPWHGQRAAEASQHPLFARTKRRRRSFPSAAEAVQAFSSKPPMKAFDSRAVQSYVAHGFEHGDEVLLRCSPDYEALLYLGENDILQRCGGRTQVPTLVLVGETSQHMRLPGFADTIEVYKAVAEQLGADFRALPGLGHFGPMERPDVVSRVIVDWLRTLPQDSRL